MQVHPETAERRSLKREIDGQSTAIAFEEPVADAAAYGLLDFIAAERVGRDTDQSSRCAYDWRRSGDEEKIAAAVTDYYAAKKTTTDS